jgi:hypothetical protein
VEVTQEQVRQLIVDCAKECEISLRAADAVARHGSVRERLRGIALNQGDARLLSDCAFTWASMLEVSQ